MQVCHDDIQAYPGMLLQIYETKRGNTCDQLTSNDGSLL